MVEPARTAARRLRSAALVALVAVSGTVGVLGGQALASSSSPAASSPQVSPSSPAASPVDIGRPEDRGAPGEAGGISPVGTPLLRGEQQPGAVGEADGVVPDGTTVFEDGVPAVANLNPALLRALRRAATDAAGDGVEFYVDSGWRSRAYQEQLFRQAISQYGSEEKAARWVAAPGTSAHESGSAVDVGHANATVWLSGHGAAYGLCQIYVNEPWHYELRPAAVDHGCPPMYADPTHDPLMQQ